MYALIRHVMNVFGTSESSTIELAFKGANATARDKGKVIDYVVGENFIEADPSPNSEQYFITATGRNFRRQLDEYEAYDSILRYLQSNKASYHSLEDVCKALNIPFRENYETRLADDGLLDAVSSKDGYYYKLSAKGLRWLVSVGGYAGWLPLKIEETYFKNNKKLSEYRPISDSQTGADVEVLKGRKLVFISYSTIDENRMKILNDLIESTAPLKAVVIAKTTKAMVPFTFKVADAIIGCPFFIPILTTNSRTTQWINQEIGFAIAKEKSIFPLVESAVCEQLRGYIHQHMDLYVFNTDSDPIKDMENFIAVCRRIVSDIADLG